MSKRFTKLLSLVLCIVMLITSFTFAQAPKIQYQDIKGHWAESQIADWISKDLIKGLGDNTYGPDKNISRAEFVTLVNRIYAFEEKTEVPFTDITDTTKWYYDEVAKAVKAGYIQGFDDGTFRPAAVITRQEVAAILSRIKNLDSTVNEELLKDFADRATLPAWSKGYISAVVSNKYMLGTKNGDVIKINPLKNITRAEAVTMVDRAASVYTPAPLDKQYDDLFAAVAKTGQVSAMQQKSNFSIGFKATGLSEENQQMMDLLSEMFGNISINTNSKIIKNDDETSLKSQVDANIKAGSDFDFATKIWSDTNISANGTQFKQIYEVPEMLKQLLPEELSNKKYMVIDENEDGTIPAADFDKLMGLNKELEEKISAFVKGFVLESNNKYNIIHDQRSKVVETADGKLQIAHVYQITINDATLKAMLSDVVANADQNKELIELLQEYLNLSMSLSGEASEPIDFTQFKADFVKFMDAIKDVKIIGDKGLVINFAINQDGMIKNTNGSVDLVLDIAKLDGAIAKLDPTFEPGTETGIFTINLKFDNINYDMNKELTISFPETNVDNSFNIKELDKLLQENTAQ